MQVYEEERSGRKQVKGTIRDPCQSTSNRSESFFSPVEQTPNIADVDPEQ